MFVIVLCYCLYAVLLLLCCTVIVLLVFLLSYVLIVCTVPLPLGVNPIAVDKYINQISVVEKVALGQFFSEYFLFFPLPVSFRQCSTFAHIYDPINLAIGSVLRQHASAGILMLFGRSAEETICVWGKVCNRRAKEIPDEEFNNLLSLRSNSINYPEHLIA